MLPPLDAHAHVDTAIAERDLRALGAALLAVTREPREWAAALARRDRLCAWGLGCHPQLPEAVAGFDAEQLRRLLPQAAFVGEVGLDARSPVPMARQREVLQQVLGAAAEVPRLVSIHSVGASGLVLDELRACPIPGAILHWWRGSEAETRAAVTAGCWFSVNGAEVARPKVLSWLPLERVLTETDFPHTQRQDRAARKPGAVRTVEGALAELWQRPVTEVRRQLWVNLRELLRACGSAGRMPRAMQALLLYSATS